MLKKLLPDALLIGGALSVSLGAWMVYSPAGPIVAGVLAIVAGLKIASAD